MLQPAELIPIRMFDTKHSAQIDAIGYRAAMARLDQIRELAG